MPYVVPAPLVVMGSRPGASEYVPMVSVPPVTGAPVVVGAPLEPVLPVDEPEDVPVAAAFPPPPPESSPHATATNVSAVSTAAARINRFLIQAPLGRWHE